MTAHERHNRRDDILSAKHRRWGYDVPATDVDFILCEYDRKTPKALIEHRHVNGSVRFDANMTAIHNLANMAGLPFFIVQYRYEDDDGTIWNDQHRTIDTPAYFRIIVGNETAAELWFTQEVDTYINEDEYRAFLHEIRGRHT